MLALGAYEWLRDRPLGLGQVEHCCEDMSARGLTLPLSDIQQDDLVRITSSIQRGETVTPDDLTVLGDLEARCCAAFRATGIPEGATAGTLALQKQINQILSAHGCGLQPSATSSRGEDGILGSETCGAAKWINDHGWGSVRVPAQCDQLGYADPQGCTAPAAKKGGGGTALVIGAIAVAAVAAVALAGRA